MSNTLGNLTARPGKVPQAPMYTPGPWDYKVNRHDTAYEVRDAKQRLVCSMSWHERTPINFPLRTESEDNARLITAAPELLAALIDACAAMAVGMTVAHKTPGSNDALTTIQIAFANARSAIIKATVVA